ncbi:MAG TPA: metalloregulator ArsR/SmtB family transcription factor [Longimicrobiales bacterium]
MKEQVFAQFARIGRALAHPIRLEILDLLAQGEKTVERLAEQTGRSVTSTSNHLKELRGAALVETRREGTYVHYRLASDAVHELVRALQSVAHAQLAEVQRLVDDYFASSDDLETVDARELAERLGRRDVIVIDVRPADEYAAGHIPGALSMPPDEVGRRSRQLPKRKQIVAYCRGPYCVYAHDAVTLLRSRGYRARRLQSGLPGWRAEGFEVVTGGEE